MSDEQIIAIIKKRKHREQVLSAMVEVGCAIAVVLIPFLYGMLAYAFM